MLDESIKKLVEYGIACHLIPESERIYSTNLLLDIFGKSDYSDPEIEAVSESENDCANVQRTDFQVFQLSEILKSLCDEAVAMGIIEEGITSRDLFDTKLMNCITPRPSQVIDTFWKKYESSPVDATDFYYNFSRNTNYIRVDRVSKDLKWKVPSEYGDIDITINLSKPEKDPKAIAAAKTAKASGYPKCLLCMENEGYAGHMTHPARQNHRIIPIEIAGSKWGFQYSPYVYYNEHCIVFNGQHTPMAINRNTFVKLFDFIKLFPHYFLGSNADLPIVGGSILSHDHFQGGNYTFAMAKAPIVTEFQVEGFADVEAGIVKWPLSVIRLRSENVESVIHLADHILKKWRDYTDEEAFIFAETDGEIHNTITPIARFKDGKYELDLALRNNITTEEHPLGVYHPHEKLHHIKKENIGLIEVMGLAVLPARLKHEMEVLAEYMVEHKDIRSNAEIEKHADWVDEFTSDYSNINTENVMEILYAEIGKVFVQVLEDAGVYKFTEEGQKTFMKFIETL